MAELPDRTETARRLNRFVGIVAVVVASVAISTSLTLWLVAKDRTASHGDLVELVKDASSSLDPLFLPAQSAPDAAAREAEQALSVAAVQRGIAEHRVVVEQTNREAGDGRVPSYHLTVTNQDGDHPVCLVVHQQAEENGRVGSVHYTAEYGEEPCPTKGNE